MLLKLAVRIALAACLLSGMAGCFIWNVNLNDAARVRDTGYIGKRLELTYGQYLRAGKGASDFEFRSDGKDNRLFDAGTHIHITDLRYQNVLMVVDYVYTYAKVDDGPYAGLLVDISDLVEGRRLATVKEPTPALLPYRNEAMPWAALAGDAAMDAQVTGLRDKDWVVRFYAARELSGAKEGGQAAARALATTLDDGDPDVFGQVIKGLRALQPQEGETLRLMAAAVARGQSRFPEANTYNGMLEAACATCGPAMVPAIAAALPDADDLGFGRLVQVIRLVHLKHVETRGAIPAIVERARRLGSAQVSRGDEQDSWDGVLAEIPGLAEAYDTWADALADANPLVRERFAAAARTPKAIPALGKLLHDREVHVRRAASETLSHLPNPTDEIVPVLADGAHDTDARVAFVCVEALGLHVYGDLKYAEVAEPELEFAALHGSARGVALRGLDRLARNDKLEMSLRDAAFRTMVAALADRELSVRRAAVMELGNLRDEIGSSHGEARAKALAGMLKDSSRELRYEALMAIGPQGAGYVRVALEQATRDSDAEVREVAESLLKTTK